MQICKISLSHLTEALTLVKEVYQEFDAPLYSEAGNQTFYHFISYDNISEMISDGNIIFYGCYEESELVGVIAIRKINHISLLFVKASHHRRGVARKLFEVAKMSCKEENKKKVGKPFITVNASPYAVEVYKKLGFSPLSEEQIKDGIRFTPMSYPL